MAMRFALVKTVTRVRSVPLGYAYNRNPSRLYSDGPLLPRIASTSFWSSLIPRPFRSPGHLKAAIAGKKEWNPATFFILIFLVIGSNAIQLVAKKTSRLNYRRETEAKLALLREVIGRVKNGEDFDVAAALGTGDQRQEQEWEEMVKDLEREEDVFAKNQRKRARRAQAQDEAQDRKAAAITDIEVSSEDRKPGFY